MYKWVQLAWYRVRPCWKELAIYSYFIGSYILRLLGVYVFNRCHKNYEYTWWETEVSAAVVVCTLAFWNTTPCGYQCFGGICCLSAEGMKIEPAGCLKTLAVTRLHGVITQKTIIGVGLYLTLWRAAEVLNHFLGCFVLFKSHSL